MRGCGRGGGGGSQEASDVWSKEMDEMVKLASIGSANRAVHDFVSRGRSMCSRSALKKKSAEQVGQCESQAEIFPGTANHTVCETARI